MNFLFWIAKEVQTMAHGAEIIEADVMGFYVHISALNWNAKPSSE
jgi:hypothetical protein